MRIKSALSVVAVITACLACYFFGFQSGTKQSSSREDREGELTYAVGMLHAADATNLTKLHSFLDVEILAWTRDYERRFGVPNSTNRFKTVFSEATLIADQVEKKMVPTASALQSAIGSNTTGKEGK